MSESIKKIGCELHELSCPKDFGKAEMLPTKGVDGNESCKNLNGVCATEFTQIAALGNEVKVKQSRLEHALNISHKTSTTPLCERAVERECIDDHHDAKCVDNTKSVVNASEKIAPDGLDKSHVPEKTVVGEPIVEKDLAKEGSAKEVFDSDLLKKSVINDAIEETKSPKCEDSVKKSCESIESEKYSKNEEIYSGRASDGSAVSGNKTDKIVRGSKIAEPSVDESGTESLGVKNEYPQEIAAKVEEKVDDGKKVDKDETSKDKVSVSKAVDSQKVASVNDGSNKEASVKCEVSNKNTVSDIEQQNRSDLTKKSKDNE